MTEFGDEKFTVRSSTKTYRQRDMLLQTGEQFSVAKENASRSDMNTETTWKNKYEELRDRMTELGLMAFEGLSKPERYRLLVTEWIRDNHGDVKVTPNTLHSLKPEIRRKAMDRLYLTLGQNPKAKETVHDVFRRPRRRKERRQEYFSENP